MHLTLFTLLPKLHAAVQSGQLRIVLASSSPRRLEALTVMFGGNEYFDTMIPDFDEKLPHSDYNHALAYCAATAKMKAKDVCIKLKDTPQHTLVISADTVVAYKGHILEKPSSTTDAKRMLKMLSGSQHQIHTCVNVYKMPDFSEILAFCTSTHVKFAQLSDDEIAAYIATGEPLDKAGAYALQGQGRTLIESTTGDFFSGVGFPARDFAIRFAQILESMFAGASS